MKLSLIIPIYKAKEFIPRLIENLEAQNVFKNKEEYGEVLFIIDGFPDDSEKIIREYSKTRSWIKVITQENRGQHIARNTGIKIAKGEYIAFMDQDDAYIKNALKFLIEIAEKESADIVRGQALWPKEDDFSKWKDCEVQNPSDLKIYSGQEFILATNGLCYNTMVWGTLYNKDFITSKGLYFPEKVSYYEDAAYNWLIMPEAKKVITLNNIIYFWIQREKSDSHNNSKTHRIKREKNSEQSSIFYFNLFNRYKNKSNFPSNIYNMMLLESQWSCYKYLGTMVKLRGLEKSDITSTINRIKDEGIYPYPHRFPKDLPSGYPKSIPYKLMWWLMSYEWILKVMLRLRAKK